MIRGNRDALRQKNMLRVALVLLMLTALVVFGGCELRGHNSASGQPGQTTQPTTGQQTGGIQPTGSSSAAQQIQDADQQVQDALQSADGAQNDANNANTQAGQENNIVP